MFCTSPCTRTHGNVSPIGKKVTTKTRRFLVIRNLPDALNIGEIIQYMMVGIKQPTHNPSFDLLALCAKTFDVMLYIKNVKYSSAVAAKEWSKTYATSSTERLANKRGIEQYGNDYEGSQNKSYKTSHRNKSTDEFSPLPPSKNANPNVVWIDLGVPPYFLFYLYTAQF